MQRYLNICRSILTACGEAWQVVTARDNDGHGYEQFAVGAGHPEAFATELDEHGHPTPAGLAGGEAFMARARNWTPLAWWLHDMRGRLAVAAQIVACGALGHEIVDAGSYAGPEHGAQHLACSRCGYSWSHTYY